MFNSKFVKYLSLISLNLQALLDSVNIFYGCKTSYEEYDIDHSISVSVLALLWLYFTIKIDGKYL